VAEGIIGWKRHARLLLRSDTNPNCLTDGGTVAVSGTNVDLTFDLSHAEAKDPVRAWHWGADLHWRPLTGDNAERSIHAEFEAASAFKKQDSC
jgi:hypothetical protein